MLIERMRKRLAAESKLSSPACRPQPTSLRPAPTGFTRSSTTATRVIARDGRAADPSAGRCFIIRPSPLMGTTNPARNDQRVVPPKCAAYFLGYAK